MSDFVVEAAEAATVLSATGDVFTGNGVLLGFHVNSSSSGTLILKNGGSDGTALNGVMTHASVGFHKFPVKITGGLHATIGGSALNVTFFYTPTL